jgi:hypothetical protein
MKNYLPFSFIGNINPLIVAYKKADLKQLDKLIIQVLASGFTTLILFSFLFHFLNSL